MASPGPQPATSTGLRSVLGLSLTLSAVTFGNLFPGPARLLGCLVLLKALFPRRTAGGLSRTTRASGARSSSLRGRRTCVQTILLSVACAIALGPLNGMLPPDFSLGEASLGLARTSIWGAGTAKSWGDRGCGVQGTGFVGAAGGGGGSRSATQPLQAQAEQGDIVGGGGWWNQWVMRWFQLEDPEQGPRTGFDPKSRGSKGDLQRDLEPLGRLAKHEWKTLSLGVGCLLVAAGMRTLIPQAVAQTLIAALKPGVGEDFQRKALMHSAKRLGKLALGYGFFSGIRGLVMSIAENRLLSRLRRQTFSRILQQDINFHDERDVGELTSRLNSDCEAVASGLSMNFNIFLRSGVQLVFGVMYLTYTSWQLSSILVVVWGLLFYVYAVYGRFARRSSLLRQDKIAGLNSVATEALSNVRTLRAFAGEEAMMEKYDLASEKLIFLEHQRAAAYGIYATFYNGLTEGIKAVALATGGILVSQGVVNAEQLAASMLYVDNVVSSSLAVGGQYRQLMQAIGSSRKVFEYAEMQPSASVVATSESPT
ncbi:unnamed protein product [Polarella glacialis]|uniref:ABC transmembrane type-1 domain-containing protein n=1 Tax=Polarella glacialis TaxID=89957 RepID=A0A813LJF2_POLGL|nr:unnamed protein product [Polarella glacialis]